MLLVFIESIALYLIFYYSSQKFLVLANFNWIQIFHYCSLYSKVSNYDKLVNNLFAMEIYSLFEICHFGELEPCKVLVLLYFVHFLFILYLMIFSG